MAELPGIERETLDVDVVIVGAGPAGLAAAYRLAELVKAEEKLAGLSIAVLEKGKAAGRKLRHRPRRARSLDGADRR